MRHRLTGHVVDSPWMKRFGSPPLCTLAAVLLICALASMPALPAEAGDFEELPLAPIPPAAAEEEEDLVDEAAPVDEGEAPRAVEVDEAPGEHPLRRIPASPGARKPAGGLAVLIHGGAFLPILELHSPGMEVGVGMERASTLGPLRARGDLRWTNHRLEDSVIVPDRGLDSGFAQVSNLVVARIGLSWHPFGSEVSASGPFVHAGLGAALAVTERRVFSEESRSTRVRPTGSFGVGFDAAAGPGRLRIESAIHGLSLPVGLEDSPSTSAMAGLTLALAYHLAL